LKKFVDDFSVLAVESCLVQKLPTLFCPEDVLDIDDTTVATLASEDEESTTERARCNEKLKILEEGLKALQSVQEYPVDLEGMSDSNSVGKCILMPLGSTTLPSRTIIAQEKKGPKKILQPG
jgi:hypothetical protein